MANTLKGKLAEIVTNVTAILADTANIDAKQRVQVAFAAADVLDNVQNALFTISGGRVKILNIILEIEDNAVDNATGNTKLIFNPTVGADVDLCAVLDLDSAAVGSLLTITGVLSDAMVKLNGVAKEMAPLVLAEGTIDILSSADVGTGDALVSAIIEYVPVDSGASIA